MLGFIRAAFEGEADFTQAAFGFTARFTGATFGDIAHFTGAAFGGHALFTGSAFGGYANFSQTHFEGRARFSGMSEEQWAGDFINVDGTGGEPSATLKQRHKESWTRDASGPYRLLSISFERARFDGEADFSGRSFEQAANFTEARFYYPPDFDAAANVHRIDFTGAYIRFVPPGKLVHWAYPASLARFSKNRARN